MSDIVWEDPPVAARAAGNSLYLDLFAELKAHPGKWAIFPKTFTSKKTANATAGNIRRGAYKALPGCESAYRVVDGKPLVYVRFVGES